MMYITCEKRKNAPKINVVICEKKCEHAKTCKSYLNYLKTVSGQTPLDKRAPSGEELIALKSTASKQDPLLAAGE